MKCRLTVVVQIFLLSLFLAGLAQPQTRAARRAQKPAVRPLYKGIWEPVNYNADVKLFDVFFATAEEGWVSGGTSEVRGGIILHTQDGGSHWQLEYGDPESSDYAVVKMRFLDSTHGWAMQGTGSAAHLLHTTDGQNWNLAGTIPEHTVDYMFISETDGVALESHQILKTSDGGGSWHPVADCEATAQMQGLARRLDCQWVRLQFVSRTTAYAVGYNGEAKHVVFLARTDDGGASWSLITSEAADDPQDAFFIDENVGYIRTGFPDTGQIFKTTDGGKTWAGMGASPGERIQFADPEVGWAVLYNKVSFTTDGGMRWNSREYPFPAHVYAFSLPRRDRGYIVGEHGMIFRYRLVPENYTAAGMIPAPLLSGINSPLDDQMLALVSQVQRIAQSAGIPQQQIATAVNPPPGSATTTVDASTSPSSNVSQDAVGVSSGGFTQDTSTASSTTASGISPAAGGAFVQDTSAADSTVNAMSATATQFVSKYRNLNLLMAGIQIAAQMPQQIQSLKQSLASLKQVRDPQAATAAVQGILAQVGGLRQSIRTAFQKPQL